MDTKTLGAAGPFVKSLDKEETDEIIAAVGSLVVSLGLMFKAARARKRGNWQEAIYYAVLWVGATNNGANAQRARRERRQPKMKYTFNPGNLS